MSLFRRNKRAREEGDEAAAAEPSLPASEHQTAEHPDGHAFGETPGYPAHETVTDTSAPAVASGRTAGELDSLVGEAPSSRRRGKLRRRLRHLRRVREVLLRDLGGLTFELHRIGGGEGGPVLEGKLARLAAVDRELRELEEHLSDHRAMIVREPGIGGTCAECGELFGSEARYCWACGNPVAAGRGGAPHLAAWTTHPQLAGGEAPTTATPLQAPSVDSTLVEQEHPTAPLPQMDPETVAAEAPAANEPATGDVGGDSGAVWSTFVDAPAVDPSTRAPESFPAREAIAEPAQEAPPEHQPLAEPATEATQEDEPFADPAHEATQEHQPLADPAHGAAPEHAEEQPASPTVADEAPAAVEEAPADPPPSPFPTWPARDGEAPPELSSGDPLASPQRPAQS